MKVEKVEKVEESKKSKKSNKLKVENVHVGASVVPRGYLFLIRSLGMANPQLKTYLIVLFAAQKNFKALTLNLGWRISIKVDIFRVVVVF